MHPESKNITAADEHWYGFDSVQGLDTPALVIYLDRVMHNIRELINSIDDIKRLRPHVKTHKSMAVTKLMMDMGIQKFKCATIAEAEMLAMADAKDILLAYQPVGPKIDRLIALIKKYPNSSFSCLIDNQDSANAIAEKATIHQIQIPVYIDLNVGMNRTGIMADERAVALGEQIAKLASLSLIGLHAYDGHVEEPDLTERTKICNEILDQVIAVQEQLENKGMNLLLVLGGSPTFPVYAKKKSIECSPGTFVFWDKSYATSVPEQHFLPAALIIGRVISFPAEDKLTIDIGHKAIAAEYPLPSRIHFLNAPALEIVGHSEEHLVVKAPNQASYQIGDLCFGLPMHICPTVALHQNAVVIADRRIVDNWEITSRNRTINI
ncbi:MAG: D-TA family PLP-dependent enzyme [Pedobacter sp.]|nr:D-TA family PLP-dependent enzyme [Pedobacter sp.]MDQ8051866.1 D-TA family PLP-dependent enzyme [Pedobacter sp.]